VTHTKNDAAPKIKPAKGEAIPVGEHMVVDPRICHGKMTFRGTRVPVETILYYIATGHSLDYLRNSWPEVSAAAIEEALHLATAVFLEHYGSKRT
jgi:uncharacterized protein (DUF433 family)